MSWTSQGCLSVLYRHTVKNVGRQRGNMQNSMVSRHYRQRTEKQHDFGLICGQNIGCRLGVLTVSRMLGTKIRGAGKERFCALPGRKRIMGGLHGR